MRSQTRPLLRVGSHEGRSEVNILGVVNPLHGVGAHSPCPSVGELVVWHAGDVDDAIDRLEGFGVHTHKHRSAKQMGPLKMAK